MVPCLIVRAGCCKPSGLITMIDIQIGLQKFGKCLLQGWDALYQVPDPAIYPVQGPPTALPFPARAEQGVVAQSERAWVESSRTMKREEVFELRESFGYVKRKQCDGNEGDWECRSLRWNWLYRDIFERILWLVKLAFEIFVHIVKPPWAPFVLIQSMLLVLHYSITLLEGLKVSQFIHIFIHVVVYCLLQKLVVIFSLRKLFWHQNQSNHIAMKNSSNLQLFVVETDAKPITLYAIQLISTYPRSYLPNNSLPWPHPYPLSRQVASRAGPQYA